MSESTAVKRHNLTKKNLEYALSASRLSYGTPRVAVGWRTLKDGEMAWVGLSKRDLAELRAAASPVTQLRAWEWDALEIQATGHKWVVYRRQ